MERDLTAAFILDVIQDEVGWKTETVVGEVSTLVNATIPDSELFFVAMIREDAGQVSVMLSVGDGRELLGGAMMLHGANDATIDLAVRNAINVSIDHTTL